MWNLAAYQRAYREFYIKKNWIWHPRLTWKLFYYWKSTHLHFSLNCCQHCVQPGSIPLQSILHRIWIQHCRKPLIATIYCRQEISNYMLKNPAYFYFCLIAAIVAFILAAIGFRVFHIDWKLDLEPQISLDISSK